MRISFFAACAAALLFCAPSAQLAAQSTPAPRPTAAFAAVSELRAPTLSPDGRKLATQVEIKGAPYLMIVSLDGANPAFVKVDNSELNWWRWVNNDWLVIGLGDMRGLENMDAYVRRAVGVSADGTRMVPLLKTLEDVAQIADDVIWTAHDGSPRILLTAQRSAYSDELKFWPEVYEVDVSTGKFKQAQAPRSGVLDWIADGSGAVRLGVGIDNFGNQDRILYRPTPGAPFREFPGKAADGTDAKYPRIILSDGRGIAISDDAQGYSVVYDYDFAKMAPGQPIMQSSGYDVAGVRIDDDRSKLLGVDIEEHSSSVRWIDPAMKALQTEIDGMVKGAAGTIISTSRDLNRSIVLFSSADAPGAYFLYDRPSGDMKQIGFVNPQIRLDKLNPVSMIRYQSRDGVPISAVLTLPRARAAQKLPLIVLPHGGPFARDSLSWDWWPQLLAERGYAVVQPNYRGSSGYGTAFTKKGEGEWGLKMQDDLIDAITHLAKEGRVDPNRVCIAGASYGGYAAMRASQRDAKHYRCAISYAGVSDLSRLSRNSYRDLFGDKTKSWLKRQAPSLASVSPIKTPEATAIPLLLVHGRKDSRVPVTHSRDMAAKLKKAGREVVYIEQPLGDHHFSRSADRLEFLRAMEAFLAKHNPA
jgi:dipeptidyl aminopeptidase/acylaminoacyl peptidase